MRRLIAQHQRGMTLVELMVGLVIMAILISAAAPFMGDMIVNARLRESGNLLFTEALMAQSEAIKRNAPILLCAGTGGVCRAAPGAGDWTAGWLRLRLSCAHARWPTASLRPPPVSTSAAKAGLRPSAPRWQSI